MLLIYLGIDEFNKLNEFDPKLFRDIFNIVGDTMCQPPTGVFLLPFFTGTAAVQMSNIIGKSMHPSQSIPMKLLTSSDYEAIVDDLDWKKKYHVNWRTSSPFRCFLADCGSSPRSLELYLQSVENHLDQNRSLQLINWSELITKFFIALEIRYPLQYTVSIDWAARAAAYALLDQAITPLSLIMPGGPTWLLLSEYGFFILEPMVIVFIPPIIFCAVNDIQVLILLSMFNENICIYVCMDRVNHCIMCECRIYGYGIG
jgi:hypothetical protein